MELLIKAAITHVMVVHIFALFNPVNPFLKKILLHCPLWVCEYIAAKIKA